MTQHRGYNGYDRVKLSRGCKRGMYLVHRLVAETFLDNPENYPIVNHLNSCRHDNRVENLEWTTNSKNQLQRFRENGFKGTNRKAVKQIDPETGDVVKIWETMQETGINNVSAVCRGVRPLAGGYYWEYA